MQQLFPKKSFDDGVKEEIRNAINIADVVGRHVALRPAGQNLKGLCPFHKEKTPSFTVSPAKGIFYCFGCHKGGDVFKFLMELEGLTFPEALRLLADEAGIKLAPSRLESAVPASGQAAIPKDELLKINNLALDFYYHQTRNHKQAVDYFVSRGLSKETIREFRLGYAPPGWSAFLEHAKSKGVGEKPVVLAGLAIVKQETGGAYDRFRDRIIFPIFDTSKRPVGFAGRGLTADATPKYLNSPETPLYQKSKILYGFHVTQQFVRESKSVIIVEGYMDFLALYQAGIKNVIATSGTAFTDTHARILRRFTDKLFLVFDGDAAGILAAQRAIFVLAPYNFNIRVLTIPEDEDPDEYVKARGPQAFNELLEKSSKDYMKFIIAKTAADNRAETPYGKSAALNALAPLAQALSDAVVQREFVKQMGEALSLTEDVIYQRIRQRQGPAAPRPVRQESEDTAAAFFGTIEGNFIRLLLANPHLVLEARQFIAPETFTDKFSGELYLTVLRSYDESPDLVTLLKNVRDDETGRMLSFAFANEADAGNPNDELVHVMRRLQEKFIRSKIKANQEIMKKDPGQRAVLLEKNRDLSLQLKDLT
ncbi:MAG TPA: DNA primase [Chitinivibrionales bacterium]|nr:DNA primase [Chitinivibrionales bacterium]